MIRWLAVFASLVGLSAVYVLTTCSEKASSGSGPVVKPRYVDYFRIELETPGGPLPFIVESDKRRRQANQDWVLPLERPAVLINSSERIGVMLKTNERVWTTRIPFDAFDAEVVLDPQMEETDEPRTGVYTKNRGNMTASVPVRMTEASGPRDRFDRRYPIEPAATTAINGRWVVEFAGYEDEALGIFEVDADGHATGTFLTTTGDYRFLDGVVDGRTLKLSCFDGGHAFLFHAELREDGTLAGDFWSGNWYHDTWTARPAPEGFAMPDGFAQSAWQQDVGLEGLTFTVPEANGDPATLEDVIEASGGYPAIIEVFGTWCPNCHDAAAAVKALRAEFGITVVGLAFELTPDFGRSVRQIDAFKAKHDTDWPVLLAGVADKDEASKALPALDRVRAYPTTIFVNAAGEVDSVHTGFVGPAAPEEHAALMAKLRETTRRLIEEAKPPSSETPGVE